MYSQIANGHSCNDILACLLDTPDFRAGTAADIDARSATVKAACRKDARDLKSAAGDTSIAGIIEHHRAHGTYIDTLSPDSPSTLRKLKNSWAGIEDAHAPLLVAVDLEHGCFAVTTKAIVETTLRELVNVAAAERAASIDATFNLTRDKKVLSTIGVNSIDTTTLSKVRQPT